MSASDFIRSGVVIEAQPFPRYVLEPAAWAEMAARLPAQPTLSLTALWADTTHIHALFTDEAEGDVLAASVPVADGSYTALSPARPAAAWFERMIHDLWGHAALGGTDARRWIDHGRWGIARPMAPKPEPAGGAPEPPEFLPVEGEDLHQIAIGPIHAGIIEPGHFRFTAAGETVARMEVRLGYTHKGTLLLMRGKSPRIAARFAARLSGDATVAHSIAFARAAEFASNTEAPPRAVMLRAVMAEIERIANHLGDLGAVCNDAAFAFALARFGLHREQMLRAASALFGHRLMMDCVIPGGVAADLDPAGLPVLHAALEAMMKEMPSLTRIYDDYASLMDRVVGTGRVSRVLVDSFATGGYIARASGRRVDARAFPAYPPYDALGVLAPTREDGDVDARLRIRLDEIGDSVRIIRSVLANLPDGPLTVVLPQASGEGFGWAESFRGDVWHWLRLDGGLIAAAFMRDPSWLQWPLLESAVLGNIVGDFPLINKSFNCSYSGVDL